MGGVCLRGTTEKSSGGREALLSYAEDVNAARISADGNTYQPPKIENETALKSAEPNKNANKFKISKKLTVEDFTMVKCVGKGSFAKVMMVKKKDTGRTYAMKILKKKDLVKRKQVEHTMTEREVISNINHPFIVSLHFSFQSDTKLYLITDFFNGGELFWHLKNEGSFSETRTRFYSAEIILALECLHSHGTVYRDMKPENLLLDSDGHIRLTDFGLSKDTLTGNNLTHTFCGTPEYLAPEVIRQEGYGKAVDWWALGVLIYEMLHGLPPFYDKNLRDMYNAIVHQPLTFPRSFSKEVKEVISQLMDRDPMERLGAEGAAEVKQAEFFVTIDFEKLYKKQIPPPYIPSTTADDDIQNVDDEFLEENVTDTYIPRTKSVINAANEFPNFTYMPDKKDEY